MICITTKRIVLLSLSFVALIISTSANSYAQSQNECLCDSNDMCTMSQTGELCETVEVTPTPEETPICELMPGGCDDSGGGDDGEGCQGDDCNGDGGPEPTPTPTATPIATPTPVEICVANPQAYAEVSLGIINGCNTAAIYSNNSFICTDELLQILFSAATNELCNLEADSDWDIELPTICIPNSQAYGVCVTDSVEHRIDMCLLTQKDTWCDLDLIDIDIRECAVEHFCLSGADVGITPDPSFNLLYSDPGRSRK